MIAFVQHQCSAHKDCHYKNARPQKCVELLCLRHHVLCSVILIPPGHWSKPVLINSPNNLHSKRASPQLQVTNQFISLHHTHTSKTLNPNSSTSRPSLLQEEACRCTLERHHTRKELDTLSGARGDTCRFARHCQCRLSLSVIDLLHLPDRFW